MARRNIKYPAELRESMEGQFLYSLWQRIRRRGREPLFDQYSNFYAWAMENGYKYGMVLYIIDVSKPCGPGNCEWVMPKQQEQPTYKEQDRRRISEWNRTVNRIRVYYGMTPFPVEVENDG